MTNKIRCSIFKKTTDDWCPSYTLMDWYKGVEHQTLVEVILTRTGPNLDTDWRVCAWGGDDFGMEKDFTTYDEAWNCFIQVISLETVNISTLKDMGFINA